MDDSKEYSVFKIPPREFTNENEKILSVSGNSSIPLSFDVPSFAEIEIDSSPPPTPNSSLSSLQTQRPIPMAQPIQPRAHDPIRERFYEMRRLASVKPFARNDSELFYRQAKFMEDFTDDYELNAKFNMYYPYYQNMGYDYLRTYFTWRTKVREGDMQPTSLSYIFLYIYELLSGIGTSNPYTGLIKLLEIWNMFSKFNTPIEKCLSKWFKDYHVFYEMPHSFSEFVEEHNMHKYYSLSLLFDENTENKLELWNGISGYDVMKSGFYKDGNQELLSNCFSAVLSGIQEFCKKRETRFEDLLIYSVSRRSPWQPFKQALFGSRERQTDREVIISDYERYYCKNGQWTANLPIYYSSQKEFVGYIIKKTEACLRQTVNYKYKLVADLKQGSKPFRELQRPAAKRAELDKVIEKAVADFYRELTIKKVEVNHINLARIREEALETQEQLIVPDVGATVLGRPPVVPDAETNILGHQSVVPDVGATVPGRPPEIQTNEPPLTLSFADGWKALKNALTDIERQALSLALQEGADIKAFANESNIMLEVLADGINEKAADYIGDSILELDEEMILYDEYKDNIVSLIK